MNERSLSMIGLCNMQVVLEMFWKMILLEGWKFLSMNFQANTIRRFCKRTQDASPTCLQLRSLCIGSYYLALYERSIPRKMNGLIPLYIQLVIWLQMAFLCLSNHREWWEVLYNLFLQTSLIGIGLKVLTTFLLCHTTLMHASTLKWVNLFLFIYLSYFPYILLINFLNAFWFLNQLTWICGFLKSCWGCYLSGISNYWYILVIKCCILAVSFYFHQLLIYVPPFFILFAGREGYRKRNSSLAPTCHLGANTWTKKSCLLKRWLHYSSSICSSIENANPPDSWKNTSVNFCLLQRIVLWCRKWPRRWLLCKVILT